MDALPFEEDKYKIDAYFHPCLFQNDLKNKADISMLEGLGKSEIVICISNGIWYFLVIVLEQFYFSYHYFIEF